MATPIIGLRNEELLNKTDFSNLKSDVAAAASVLSLYSISKFAINQVLLIGAFGQETAEIIATHSSTPPSGNGVTLAAALAQPHPKDTKVSIMLYNQVEILYSLTETGSKTSITTIAIDPQKKETTYIPTETTGYYFLRWYNSVNAASSDYSDPIPATGFGSNTISYIIDLALSETNKTLSDKLTIDNLLAAVNSCLRHVRGKLKKWSNVEEFNYVLDTIGRGEYRWALPTTYYDKNSNRSMLGVRVKDTPLRYVDQTELRDRMTGVRNTTIGTAAAIADTTLAISNAADFAASGSIHVYSGTTQYAITYTGKSGNTLTGIPASGDGSITAVLDAGLSVWQGESEGMPTVYTIEDGYISIWPLSNSAEAGRNIILDFYTDIVEVNSDADEIDLARHDMVKYWLKWHIRNVAERNGKPDFQDGDWLMFNGTLTDAVRRETTGQRYRQVPRLNGIFYRGGRTGVRYKGDPTLYLQH